jgi:hypothetical protein
MNYRISIVLLPLLLAACGGESGTQLSSTGSPTLGAASAHPCNEEYEFQAELNGAADFVDSEEDTVDGEVIVTERHVYSSAQLVVNYTFAQGGDWCNVWTEGGGV